ncbi:MULTISPECIES: hypothetical protein [unclassified Streptomyces]|uniref:hypothetical protein n=1 Tax=unclassified Streptomyces TaxID=2593676 RepID=UPI0004BDC1FD|nr:MULTISPECIES: hypothetical protein [unclassified Streptomyces]
MTETTATGGTEWRGREKAARWLLTADFIDSCLQGAGRSYQQGELAYLAMTSQIENPVRDRVAYEMHQILKGTRTRLDVGREWTGLFTDGEDGRPVRRQVDLAVVEKPRRRRAYVPYPHGVVEFKAFYAHQARSVGQLNGIYRKVLKDVEKCRTSSGGMMGEVFSVVLLPSMRLASSRIPHQIMRKIEGKVLMDDLMRETGRLSNEATLEQVSGRLSRLGPVQDGLIDAGTDSGVQVTVPYVILGPVPVETYENPPWL